MVRTTAWVLALFLGCAAPAAAALQAAAQGQDTPQKSSSREGERREGRDRWKWWLHDRQELGLTDGQAAAINDIFESTISRLRETRQAADRAEDELSKTIREGTADIAVVSALVDRFETLRAENNRIRVLMLYRMHRELRPDQRAKLQQLRERNESRRRDGDHKR
jgi:Spy/CpxP family protein refolding chaperone